MPSKKPVKKARRRVQSPSNAAAFATSSQKVRAVLLSCSVSRVDFESIEFDSPDSLLGFDLVVFDPRAAFNSYTTLAQLYRGLPSLTEASSSKIVSDTTRRREEFITLLNDGKSLFILTPQPIECYIDTGTRTHSGTGRNQKTTIKVDRFDFWRSILPVSVPIQVGRGKKVAFTDNPVAVAFRATEEFMYHEALIDGKDLCPLALIPGTKNVIGALIKAGRGNIILLPRPNSQQDVGKENGEWLTQYGRFLDSTLQAHKLLATSGVEVLPPWTNDVQTDDEAAERTELKKRLKTLTEAQQAVERIEIRLRNLERRKLLLTANGKPLEAIVAQTLRHFGFDVEERDDARTDLIVKYEGRVGVCEVKGLTGSAREKNATQLEKWVSIYHVESGVEPKGILIANTYREQPILEREGDSFPAQMLPYARRKELSLVNTTQLFVADVLYDKHPDRVRRFCHAMFDSVGIVIEDFSDIREVAHRIVRASTEDAVDAAAVY